MNSSILSARSSFRSRRGFTLLEMLTVLIIIALLMGMVIYSMTGVGEGAKAEKAQADLNGFTQLLANYELNCGNLPTTEQGLDALATKPTIEPVPPHWRRVLKTVTLDPWGHPYQYRYPGKHNTDEYDVYSMGPDGLPDTDDDIGNWTAPKTTGSQVSTQ